MKPSARLCTTLPAALLCLALAPLGAAVALADAASPDITTGSDAASAEPTLLEQYAPQIRMLDDGTLVQRTPSEGANLWTLDGSYTYHMPEGDFVPYNTYYLKADSRGCNACHADLAQTLNDAPYQHVDLSNSYGIQINVQMCQDCHTFGWGYITNQNAFGSLIHGIHATGQADCWNCHVATGSGEGMQLWDKAKHEQLRGITAVPDVQGDFSWDQDRTTPVDKLFNFGWDYFELDYLRTANTANDAPLDQQMFDEWTITVSGEVGQEVTYTLPELIERFESVTVPVTFHCTLNPTGGPLIGNAVYTGIRLTDLLAEAGADLSTMGGITVMAPDGFTESVLADNFSEAYICYQIDGEPLPWAQGYPVQLVVPHTAAPASVKQVSDIVVITPEEAASIHEWNGWPRQTEGTDYYTPGNWPMEDSNGYQNKPNVALFDFVEGQVIKTGQPYEFTGYATAYDQPIVALEFSMDGGATWTRFDTEGAAADNWVIWHFTYTPEFDSAYVLSVRSVSADGRVTEEPIEVLFNAVTFADQQ